MRNFIRIAPIVVALMVVSCQKDQKADELVLQDSTVVEEPLAAEEPVVDVQSELIAAAQSKPLTQVALSESQFDFGKIKKGDQKEHVYEVTNTGKNPLIISQVKPGCGCTVPDYTKEPILPGKKGKITLKFDSSSFDGLVSKQAEVYANVEKTPIVISFTADIQP